MSNELTLIIIGLYTVIYVIVFFVQKSQIDKIKSVNESMKSFMDIFNIDEVKKYVKLKEETLTMQAANFIADDEKVKEHTYSFVKQHTNIIKKEQLEQLDGQHMEMARFISLFLMSIPKEDAERAIKENLKSCESIFQPIIEEYNSKDKND